MDQLDLMYRFGTALIIGALIGLERELSLESDRKSFGGVRTFPLFGLVGASGAYLAGSLQSVWVFVAFAGIAGVLIAVAYFNEARQGHLGMTSEIAAILTVIMGALCQLGELPLAVAMAVITMALLSMKIQMHRLATRVTREDIFATLKFAIITAIVLPVLPNRGFGSPPFDVINPYRIWLMVVLISGIGFVGYLSVKFVSAKKGIGLTGFLGGLVSSTAVTLSFAQRSKTEPGISRLFGLGVILAWLVMFARVLIEVAAINRQLLAVVWIPIAAAGLAALVYVAYLYYGTGKEQSEAVVLKNPFELGPAIQFGILYGVIIFVARAAEMYFGDTGIYISSVLAGLADVDAITLSMSELSGPSGDISLGTAARAIVIASISNTFVKAGIVFVAGSAMLKKTIWPGVVLISVVGISVAMMV